MHIISKSFCLTCSASTPECGKTSQTTAESRRYPPPSPLCSQRVRRNHQQITKSPQQTNLHPKIVYKFEICIPKNQQKQKNTKKTNKFTFPFWHLDFSCHFPNDANDAGRPHRPPRWPRSSKNSKPMLWGPRWGWRSPLFILKDIFKLSISLKIVVFSNRF